MNHDPKDRNDNNTSRFTIHSYFSIDEDEGEVRSLTANLIGTGDLDAWEDRIGNVVGELEMGGFGTFDVTGGEDFVAEYDFADNTYTDQAEHDRNQDAAFQKACELLTSHGFTVVSTDIRSTRSEN